MRIIHKNCKTLGTCWRSGCRHNDKGLPCATDKLFRQRVVADRQEMTECAAQLQVNMCFQRLMQLKEGRSLTYLKKAMPAKQLVPWAKQMMWEPSTNQRDQPERARGWPGSHYTVRSLKVAQKRKSPVIATATQQKCRILALAAVIRDRRSSLVRDNQVRRSQSETPCQQHACV